MSDNATAEPVEQATGTESFEFQTEVSQLLQLMIHSLYSNSEIFLRELVSNASDACDKLRFAAVSDDSLLGGDSELKVQIECDEQAGTVTVRDNGIGMNRQEVIDNIGTIARSGTKRFLEAMDGEQKSEATLIGQFGVGFYASFIVAKSVTLRTRRAGEEQAYEWRSEGSGSFTLGEIDSAPRGTEVILTLRDEAKEFLSDWRLRQIVKKYSDHIVFPVQMLDKTPAADAEDDDAEASAKQDNTPVWETINTAKALWQQSTRDLSEDDYKQFYQSLTNDYGDPLLWLHNKVEGNQEYTTLFYVPERAPFDLYERESQSGIKLFVQRVFILEDNQKLLPRYLRFMRGLVDSADLPLNVSRELLQDNKHIERIRNASIKRLLGQFDKLAQDDAEKYEKFWELYGQVLKEGVAEEHKQRDELLKLFRLHSTEGEGWVSLADYVGRMKEGQDKIYYLTADSATAAANSPHLEGFRSKGLEVLLLSDRVDEWMMSYLHEFDGKSFVSVAKGDLDLSSFENEEEKSKREEQAKESEPLLKRLRETLGERVEDVRIGQRLTDSPSCVVLGENDMALYMQQLMRQAGQEGPSSKPVLEVNIQHALVQRIDQEPDEDRFAEWAEVLLDQAILAEGGQLSDGAGFVRKLNGLLLAN